MGQRPMARAGRAAKPKVFSRAPRAPTPGFSSHLREVRSINWRAVQHANARVFFICFLDFPGTWKICASGTGGKVRVPVNHRSNLTSKDERQVSVEVGMRCSLE